MLSFGSSKTITAEVQSDIYEVAINLQADCDTIVFACSCLSARVPFVICRLWVKIVYM